MDDMDFTELDGMIKQVFAHLPTKHPLHDKVVKAYIILRSMVRQESLWFVDVDGGGTVVSLAQSNHWCPVVVPFRSGATRCGIV